MFICSETEHQSQYIEKHLAADTPSEEFTKTKTAPPAFPGESVRPAKVPWLGKTEYQCKYTGDAADVPTILRQYVPIHAPFIGESTYRTFYDKEVGDWQAHPKKTPKRIPALATGATFSGQGPHERDYPPWDAKPAETFYRKPAPMADLPFAGNTTYQIEHDEKPLAGARPDSFGPRRVPYEPSENRTFNTEQGDQFPPKYAMADQICPARLLPPPPPIEAAPTAYEGPHVLWDTQRKTWAIIEPTPLDKTYGTTQIW